MVAATQKRKMLCKTRRANLVITVCRSLSLHLQPEIKFSRLVTMGDPGLDLGGGGGGSGGSNPPPSAIWPLFIMTLSAVLC